MKYLTILFAILIFSASVSALASSHTGELCFSPVKERQGDKSTKRSSFQSFDYKVQVDDGPIIKPFAEKSTAYSYSSEEPVVKIWLSDEVVESFRLQKSWLKDGRNCVYFKNMYETWSVVEAWQAKKLCSCWGK